MTDFELELKRRLDDQAGQAPQAAPRVAQARYARLREGRPGAGQAFSWQAFATFALAALIVCAVTTSQVAPQMTAALVHDLRHCASAGLSCLRSQSPRPAPPVIVSPSPSFLPLPLPSGTPTPSPAAPLPSAAPVPVRTPAPNVSSPTPSTTGASWSQLYFYPASLSGWTDYYSSSALMPDSSGKARLFARYQDGSDYYVCAIANGGSTYMAKAVKGSYTTLASKPYAYQGGMFYQVQFTVKGTYLSCRIGTLDGTLAAEMNVTDSSLTAGRTAVQGYYKQFSATPA